MPSPNDLLLLSDDAAALLKAIEELRLTPYDDQNGETISAWVKGATIGYGHLIKPGEWDTYKDGITEDEAEELFQADAAPFVDVVRRTITVPVTQPQFDAMVILAFNIGPAFSSSSVAKLVNNPAAQTPYPTLEDAWKAWNKSQGKVMLGLINRRQCEWDIYSQGIYSRW